MEKVFTMTGASSIASGIIYQLSARKSCGIKNAVLLINHDAALRYAEFVLDDNSLMKIDVLSEKVLPLKASGHFRPADLSSDWIITDLRGF